MSEPTATEPTTPPTPVEPPPQGHDDALQAEKEAPKEGLLDSALFNSIEELLTKLVPENDVVVKDCWGKEIRLPSALPARRQIKVFRLFKELADMPAVRSAIDGGFDDVGGIVDVIISVASDEEVAEKLGEAFAIAHPDALDGKDPLDVLPVEEIIAGLIPFFVRFLHRSVGAMGMMTELVPQA